MTFDGVYIRLLIIRSLFCPNAMHGRFGLLSQEKASSHSMVLHRLFFFFPVCSVFLSTVSIPPAVRPPLLWQMDMENAHTFGRVQYTRKGAESGTNKSAQDLTQKGRKIAVHPAPARGSNPGSSYLNSDALTTATHI